MGINSAPHDSSVTVIVESQLRIVNPLYHQVYSLIHAGIRSTFIYFQVKMLVFVSRYTEVGVALILSCHTVPLWKGLETLIVIFLTEPSDISSSVCLNRVVINRMLRFIMEGASLLGRIPSTGISHSFTGQFTV